MNRSEFLFLYDITWANPNGDPTDENKPRIDEETGKNIVTDVRIKRTVRDYLYDVNGQEIFIREISDDKGNVQDAKTRAEDFLYNEKKEKINKKNLNLQEMKKIIDENMLKSCIDARLFGATVPIEKDSKEKGSITHAGPVQIKFAQSLHRVKMQYVKGTGAFAAGKEKANKTFREEYLLPYSLLAAYGVVNELSAQETLLTEDDVQLFMEALWNGTKNLISRSKVGQMPRFLLRIVYMEKFFHLGELDRMVHLKSSLNDEEIRDIGEVILELSDLINILKKNKGKILRIELVLDERIKTEPANFLETLQNMGLTVNIKSY